MEIWGTTILGNTHIYIYMYVYMPFASRNTSHLSYSNPLQYCLPTVFRDIHRTSFVSAPAQLIQAHFTLKKKLGARSVEGVGPVGVELKTHVCREIRRKSGNR